MIRIENLTKYYGDFKAVDNVSFNINDGEILGFLGPNGAGKTTTLKVLTCFMPPTSGTIKYKDLDVHENSMEIRQMIGYLPENAPLYEYMSTMEYLEYICDLREIRGARRKERMDAMIETCGLSKMIGKDIGELSKGYRQRVGIAQAMIHEPDILILDEPTVGLDPNQIVEIRNLIRKVGKEKTVILSTHILSEVEATCDRVVIISSGEIVADGTTDSLRSQMTGQSVLHLELKGDVPDAADVFSGLGNVATVSTMSGKNGGTVEFDIGIRGDRDIREDVFRTAVAKGWTILEMHLQENNLEDVFRNLTKSQGA
ncbi:ABC transporter ATP-binding protein [bacterium]|nr:ABC transporter ATP-binding protein [bacterium]